MLLFVVTLVETEKDDRVGWKSNSLSKVVMENGLMSPAHFPRKNLPHHARHNYLLL